MVCAHTVSALSPLERLQHKSGLYCPNDYRPTMNTADFEADTLGIPNNIRRKDFYDLCAMALGYKNVVMPEINTVTIDIHNDTDLAFLLHKTPMYYLVIEKDDIPMLLLYTNKGRHQALLWLKYQILSTIDDAFSIQSRTHRENIAADEYITGLCLGYPEQDIDFFFQRSAFMNTFSIDPENNAQSKSQFYNFLTEEWPHSDEGALLQKAKNKIHTWMQANNTTEHLKHDIDTLLTHHPTLNAYYDRVFDITP